MAVKDTGVQEGLICAVHTPMTTHGELALERVGVIADRLARAGMDGALVCGSTGEAHSLSVPERLQVAAAYQQAASGRMAVIVNVAHNCLRDACELARHAGEIGVAGIAATPPSYYEVESVTVLVDFFARIVEAAVDTPFLYYHMPSRTGVRFPAHEVLADGLKRLPTLAGYKFTGHDLDDFRACVRLVPERFGHLFATESSLLEGLAAGATGAVGGTFNYAGMLFRRLWDFHQRGRTAEAAECQRRAAALVETIGGYPVIPASKAIMGFIGLGCGPCRLPLPELTPSQTSGLRCRLEQIGFFEWGDRTVTAR